MCTFVCGRGEGKGREKLRVEFTPALRPKAGIPDLLHRQTESEGSGTSRRPDRGNGPVY